MEVSKELREAIIEFIMLTTEKGIQTKTADLFKATDKMYTSANNQAESKLANLDFEETTSNFEEAAKGYLLISQVVRQLIKNPAFKEDEVLLETMTEMAVDWRNRAKQIFGYASSYYFDLAESFKEEGDYERSTECTNMGDFMEIQKESEWHFNSLDKKVRITRLQIEAEAYAEMGRKAGEGFLGLLSNIFKRKPKPSSPEQLPELEKTAQRNGEAYIPPTLQASEDLPLRPSELFDKIKIITKSKPSMQRENYYVWWIYLDAEQNIKNQIESVTYYLHSTFPDPVRTKRNRSENFKLKTTGCGEFRIKVDIHLKSGETLSKYHWLDLGRETAK